MDVGASLPVVIDTEGIVRAQQVGAMTEAMRTSTLHQAGGDDVAGGRIGVSTLGCPVGTVNRCPVHQRAAAWSHRPR